MTDYGVTPTGFVPKSQTKITSDMEENQQSVISPTWDVDPDQPTGQINGIVSREASLIWDAMEETYHGFDRESAEGDQLDNIGKLIALPRDVPVASEVNLDCVLTSGTTLTAGSDYAENGTEEGQIWTPLEDYTASADGTFAVRFKSTVTGPTVALAGSITKVNSGPDGWTSVSQPTDANPGSDAESDIDYRIRQMSSAGAASTDNVDSIKANLLKVPGVQSANVIDNDSGYTVNGQPPNSIAPVIADQSPVIADADAVAQAVWDKKSGGVQTYGNETGQATDSDGNSRTVQFSRVNILDMYVVVTIEVDGNYAGDDAVKESVLSVQPLVSQDIVPSPISSRVMGLTGVRNVVSIDVGTANPPPYTDRFEVTSIQRGVFDSTRITVETSVWSDN